MRTANGKPLKPRGDGVRISPNPTESKHKQTAKTKSKIFSKKLKKYLENYLTDKKTCDIIKSQKKK